jgi:hypothetical protein
MRNEYAINKISFSRVEAANQVDTMDTKFLKMLGRDIVKPDFRKKKLGYLFQLLCGSHPRYLLRIQNAHDALADSVFAYFHNLTGHVWTRLFRILESWIYHRKSRNGTGKV